MLQFRTSFSEGYMSENLWLFSLLSIVVLLILLLILLQQKYTHIFIKNYRKRLKIIINLLVNLMNLAASKIS